MAYSGHSISHSPLQQARKAGQFGVVLSVGVLGDVFKILLEGQHAAILSLTGSSKGNPDEACQTKRLCPDPFSFAKGCPSLGNAHKKDCLCMLGAVVA